MGRGALDELGQSGGPSVLAPSRPRVRRARVAVPHSCPPFDLPPFGGSGDDGDGRGGNGRGGGGDGGRSDGREPDEDGKPAGTAELGLGLALVGIGTLFGIFLLAWLLMRRQTPHWPSALSPAPAALWLGTVLLCASSLALHAATGGRSQLEQRKARRALGLALALGAGFLAAQVLLWQSLGAQGFLPSTSGYGSIFYALTGLHALHVLVGLGVLAALFAASFRAGGPSARRLRLGSTYWHAMAAIWLVLFVVLYLVD